MVQFKIHLYTDNILVVWPLDYLHAYFIAPLMKLYSHKWIKEVESKLSDYLLRYLKKEPKRKIVISITSCKWATAKGQSTIAYNSP